MSKDKECGYVEQLLPGGPIYLSFTRKNSPEKVCMQTDSAQLMGI